MLSYHKDISINIMIALTQIYTKNISNKNYYYIFFSKFINGINARHPL